MKISITKLFTHFFVVYLFFYLLIQKSLFYLLFFFYILFTRLQPVSSVPSQTPNDDTFELQALDQRPTLENCPGHWIIRSNDSNNKEGKIESVDLLTKLMKIIFENEETNQVTKAEVSYYEPNLLWYQEIYPNTLSTSSPLTSASTSSKLLFDEIKKPSIDESVGCYIILLEENKENISDSKLQTLSYDMGLIIGIDANKKHLKIRFINKISYDGRVVCDENIEEVPYNSGTLKWLANRNSP